MGNHFVNLVIDESASMAGTALQSARQVATQILRVIDRRDQRSHEQTPCTAWTFADEPLLLGLEMMPKDLQLLPLSGSGASMLGRALVEVAGVSRSLIARSRGRLRHLRVSTIIVTDLEPSADWVEAGRDLASIGRLSLVATGGVGARMARSARHTVFATMIEAASLTEGRIEEMLGD